MKEKLEELLKRTESFLHHSIYVDYHSNQYTFDEIEKRYENVDLIKKTFREVELFIGNNDISHALDTKDIVDYVTDEITYEELLKIGVKKWKLL